MFNILVWCVYGLFVGSIAKSIVPGEENFGFVKTVALGVAGSYMGGAILYLLGSYDAVSPAGVIMGVAGGVLSLVLYNKLTTKTT
ncbi:GlsB/YeaQ/YmgE family stress response membrane protein [bacterium]|nr:GlsB/YeaQ/YmgE family stress response membrane protein [bacterium]NDC96062.1 GlsB/YeaQ/YmgE family stress response membrane protein [bacterium]NDD84771.1 GlsB/YeaQ/YmgE family stress response membrane protein [bacterium]NDG32719.1 GlsB/YeaQ/YmgE family stress response membrane protein [bacterium]